MIRAVLFDMDGVLVKSEEAWFKVVQRAGEKFRGHAVTREEFAPQFGQGTAADVASFHLGCSVAELDAFYADTFREFAAQLWVNPEALPLLQRLSARGLSLAVVTNTVTRLAEEILATAQLRTFFAAVVCADQVPEAKPAPDLVLRALQLLHVPASEAWMVGDSRFDRAAARSAGVHFVGLELEGDLRVEKLSQLGEHVLLTK